MREASFTKWNPQNDEDNIISKKILTYRYFFSNEKKTTVEISQLQEFQTNFSHTKTIVPL